MKTIKILLMICLVILVSACGGSDDAPAATPAAGNGFTWTENSSTTAKTATGQYNLQGSAMNLFAGTINSANGFFEINLSGSTVGTYPINNVNFFAYLSTGLNLNPTSGNVTITSFANNKVSGTFTATQPGVGSVTGTFNNIGL